MGNWGPKSRAGEVWLNIVLLTWVGVRTITYPFRYARWRLRGNGNVGNKYVVRDPKPTIRL